MPAVRHLLAVTIDTDPDGLSGATTHRETLRWDSLKQGRVLLDAFGDIPIHWFIRADRQIRSARGHCGHLLDAFADLWDAARARGHQFGWHPHLYRTRPDGTHSACISDAEAVEQLDEGWSELRTAGFRPTSVRIGEGFHCPATFRTVESYGMAVDSTAIPGRGGAPGHPMDWRRSPNQPFYPQPGDVQLPGPHRPLLEVPMTTWMVRAPYDPEPRIRYMNPALHPALFEAAVERWCETLCDASGLRLWVFIMHPEEGLPKPAPDALYAHHPQVLQQNLHHMAQAIEQLGHTWAFVDLLAAAAEWRDQV